MSQWDGDDVCIIRVPGHKDIPGNCRADELARKGTTSELSDEFSTLGIRLGTCELIIDNAIVDLVNSGRMGSLGQGQNGAKILAKIG